ncbi:GT99 family glycosyltransferase N-terminal domain-containing protein [Yersinia massiliensis]|uniref:GT99 family glycosyltransferase N-terminal domain-containing protein n=1 Tax=Yersinia massiliensis TaxID=419257 RepID=UPI0002EDF384|nr:hypothetical protein [Yersinia massiliensis]MCB5306753.1 hypothetical protein [Yersinia massiliensis]
MFSKKDNKFVFFWLPYDVKYTHTTFLTSFYLSLDRFPLESSIHIGQEKIFDVPHQDIPKNWLASYNANIPTLDILNSVEKVFIDTKIFQDLEDKYKSKNIVWSKLLTERYLPLEALIIDIFNDLKSNCDISAVVLWCNIPSVKFVAEKLGLRVIHNEMGPLRAPDYIGTCYFDFQGVNGNTELKQRFDTLNVTSMEPVNNNFDRDYLLRLFRVNEPPEPANLEEIFDIGVPLQVEDDSNILAFSNGFSNYELIRYCRSLSNNVLIRKHPSGYVDYSEITPSSEKLSPQEFIIKSKEIVTINSSIGIEAILYGKKVVILGDSPFKLFSECADQEYTIKALNFSLLNYIVPLEFLYNKEYYDWRLNNPSENDIYDCHLKYYLVQLAEREMLNNEIKEMINESNRKIDELARTVDDLKLEVQKLNKFIDEADLKIKNKSFGLNIKNLKALINKKMP